MEKLALTISDAVKSGGPCRSALYQDIRDGRLRVVKRGRSTRILVEDFKSYLASFPAVKPVGKPVKNKESDKKGRSGKGNGSF
jgi:hypothetical protein